MAGRDPLEEEFRDFVAARSGALLRTAYLLSGDWATAEDLLQTALTKTYLAWKRLGGIEAIEPYARRVMVNTSTSWWRRRWHGERPTETLPERAAVDEIEQQLDRDLLWRHLSALPTRQRAVLVLRYYEDMSESQTAALLGISPGTVKSQTSRALGTLRRRMGAEAALDLPAGADRSPARPRSASAGRPAPADAGRPAPAPAGRPAPAPAETGRPPAYAAPTMVVGADAAAVVAATAAPPRVTAPGAAPAVPVASGTDPTAQGVGPAAQDVGPAAPGAGPSDRDEELDPSGVPAGSGAGERR
ncbi:RNA polymerase sigma-70 factor, sigma-E family [Micromonospora citrea]|uniref:RNA polymerase sigma-70 factor, sigma-E family n=1 Tax=Micromonospora citrea TaxID=47855 RepID=A0A1C6UPK0_9ACTN|nr:SigE family RNA polymerase sigma factor [Micromonospora citrea]SCL55961.1 RNA polymerase sigma-70 factor, sigma-E family [Micromonospora citrea]